MTDIDTAPANAPAEPLQPENFPLAVAAGLGAALVGAAIWATVTVATQMQLGIIAIAIGYVVGQAIRATGHGRSQKFGILGAVCGLIGCVAGNLLGYFAFYAQATHIEYMDVFGRLSVPLIQKLFTVFFSPMDLIFYAIAVYEGYRFSFHK
jgi:hypothetical protein